MKGFPVSKKTFMTAISAFVLVIGAPLLLFSALGALDSMAISGWPSAQGMVVEGRVESYWYSGTTHGSDGYYMYYPRVLYAYNVSGTAYSCDSIWRLDHESRSANEAQGVVNSYPAGMAVTVYYDPSNPSHAVLDRTEGLNPLIPLAIGAAMLALGIAGLLYARDRFSREQGRR